MTMAIQDSASRMWSADGVDPFSFKNVATAMKNDLLGPVGSLHFLRRCIELPVLMSFKADVFFRKIESPVFIVGAPRSGTTFLGNAISVLPSVQYFHEPAATKCAVAHVYLNPEHWTKLSRYYKFQYRVMMVGDRKRGRLIDKTPRNCFAISFLNETFPDATFIHIYRDGCDSAFSNSKKHWMHENQDGKNVKEHAGYLLGSKAQFWTEPHRREEYESCNRLRRCAWAWRRYTESALDQLAEVPKDRQLSIRYETMAHRCKEVSLQLANFLELGSQESDRLAKSLSKVKASSIGNASRELSAADLNEMVEECGEVLTRLKYN